MKTTRLSSVGLVDKFEDILMIERVAEGMQLHQSWVIRDCRDGPF
jgi:hypothetical protein